GAARLDRSGRPDRAAAALERLVHVRGAIRAARVARLLRPRVCGAPPVVGRRAPGRERGTARARVGHRPPPLAVTVRSAAAALLGAVAIFAAAFGVLELGLRSPSYAER